MGDGNWIFGVGVRRLGVKIIRFEVGGSDWYVMGRVELDFGLEFLWDIFCLGVIWVVIVGFGNFKIFWLINIEVLIFEWIFCFYMVVFVCVGNRLFIVGLVFIEGFIVKVLFLFLIFKFDFVGFILKFISLSLVLLWCILDGVLVLVVLYLVVILMLFIFGKWCCYLYWWVVLLVFYIC